MDADDIRAALKKLIEEHREDYSGLSRLLGRNAAYVQQYVKRGTPKVLAEADRVKLARYFNVPESMLGLDRGGPISEGSLVPVPRFDVRASAGHGSFVGDEIKEPDFAFSAKWLEQFVGARPRDLSIIRVQGDSMFPTLADGDEIMVDRAAALEKPRDGIYVIRSDDMLLVKRIAVNPASSKMTISSDNPAYVSWPDCSPEDVRLIGRVIWAGRKFR